jgi:Pyruvate/2-oxoacid:ferredoxin oxidoreductase gamma subunit
MAIEIHVYGRPGQGAEIACRLLARAFSRVAREAQAFVAPRGGRGPADAAIVLDPELLAGIAPASLRPGAPIVVNAPAAPCARLHGGRAVVALDVPAIVGPHAPATAVAAALVGAFAAAIELLPLDEVLFAVEDEIPTATGEPLAACAEAWAETRPTGPSRATDDRPLSLAS